MRIRFLWRCVGVVWGFGVCDWNGDATVVAEADGCVALAMGGERAGRCGGTLLAGAAAPANVVGWD